MWSNRGSSGGSGGGSGSRSGSRSGGSGSGDGGGDFGPTAAEFGGGGAGARRGGGGGGGSGASASSSTAAGLQVDQEGAAILRAMRAHARTNRRADHAAAAAGAVTGPPPPHERHRVERRPSSSATAAAANGPAPGVHLPRGGAAAGGDGAAAIDIDADAVTDDEQGPELHGPTSASPVYARASTATASPASTGSGGAPASPASRAAADAWWESLAARAAAGDEVSEADASSAPQGALHLALLECSRNNSMTSSGSNGSNSGSSNGNSSSGAREPQPWPPPRGGDKAGTDAWRHPPAERNGGAPRPPGRSSPIRPADVVSPLGVGHGGVTVTVGRDGVARRNHARAAAAAASVPSSPWSNGGVLRPEKSPFLPSRSGVVRPPALRPPAAGGARG
jgi:hypothetical protein